MTVPQRHSASCVFGTHTPTSGTNTGPLAFKRFHFAFTDSCPLSLVAGERRGIIFCAVHMRLRDATSCSHPILMMGLNLTRIHFFTCNMGVKPCTSYYRLAVSFCSGNEPKQFRAMDATSQGLIDSSLRVCYPLEYEVLHIDNEYYCVLKVVSEVRVVLLCV